ncbi:restriction endonuclease subunit S [Bacillus massilinigeriensis]|uniref:restriction endonuclease subunit S n=1 Tax=Bacillus massilionigeriensis TaxID=1805475 RepID=UPI000A566458|nr:restriction endonuclease subunit S [Bacillus massilionigeriensis]
MKLKGSNIQWVNTIPSHWQIKELKYCLLPGSEGIKIGPFGSALKSEMLVDEGYKVYGQENLIKDNFNLGQRFISEEKFKELEVYEIAEKDVLISMMGTVGKCKVVPANIQKGIMDSHLIRIRFNENIILPEFATYLIQDSNYIKVQLDLNSKGSIMSGLNSSIIKKLKLILPPIEEQKIILKYMDKKNVDLNQIIASKNYMIDLLNQQRQSIITEAVTKGLNPNVKMKDSGVEWIGEIPEHWEVKPLYSLYKENKLKNKRNVITNVLSLSYGKIKRRDVESNYGLLPDSFETYQIIQKDDIVLRLTDLQNDKRSLRVGLVNEEGIITSAYLGLKQSDKPSLLG